MLIYNEIDNSNKQWFLDAWLKTIDDGRNVTAQRNAGDRDNMRDNHIDQVHRDTHVQVGHEYFRPANVSNDDDLIPPRDICRESTLGLDHSWGRWSQSGEPEGHRTKHPSLLEVKHANHDKCLKFEKMKRNKTRPGRYDTKQSANKRLHPDSSRNEHHRHRQRQAKLYQTVLENFMSSNIRNKRLAVGKKKRLGPRV